MCKKQTHLHCLDQYGFVETLVSTHTDDALHEDLRVRCALNQLFPHRNPITTTLCIKSTTTNRLLEQGVQRHQLTVADAPQKERSDVETPARVVRT